MKLTPLVLAITIAGFSGSLEAAKRPSSRAPKAHKAQKAPKSSKASVARVKPLKGTRTGAVAKLRREAPAPRKEAVVKTREVSKPSPGSAIPALPATPHSQPSSMVHLEKLLPAAPLLATPSASVASAAESIREVPLSLSNEIQPVIPAGAHAGLEYESLAEKLGLHLADPSHLDLLWPVETRTVSSSWGPRMRTKTVRVKTRTRAKRVRMKYQGTHKGVDLNAPMGSDVYAALDGVVLVSTRHPQYGNYVVVDHGNGVTTVYAHHSRNFAQAGDLVKRGQKIAEVGSTGRSTGPHLHFELRLNGVPRNPLPVLNDVEEIPAELMAQNSSAVPSGSK